ATSDLDKLLVVNNKSIDNLNSLLRATRNVGESTKKALERLIEMLELIKGQNTLVGEGNNKTEITNELLRKLKVIMLNINSPDGSSSGNSSGSGNSDSSNGNPLTGDQSGRYDFELEEDDLIRLILTGG